MTISTRAIAWKMVLRTPSIERCTKTEVSEAIDGRLLVDAGREVEPGTFFQV